MFHTTRLTASSVLLSLTVLFSAPLLQSKGVARDSSTGVSNRNFSTDTIPYISLSPDTLYIGTPQRDTVVLNILSNVTWFVYQDDVWFSLDRGNGFNNATVLCTAFTNQSGVERKATITVRSSGNSPNPPIEMKVAIVQPVGFYSMCQSGSDSLFGNSVILQDDFTFQWQVNTGAGFVDLQDNVFYQDAKKQWLKLKSLPTSFAGYQYRCRIGNLFTYTYSNVYGLKFRNTWQGTVSEQWENPQNWSCGLVPDNNTDVEITSGNVVINSSTTVKSLRVSPDTRLTIVSGVKLNVLN